MKALIFIREIFKKSPFLLSINAFLLFWVNLVDAVSIFSLIVVTDLFLNPSLTGSSPISQRVVAAFKSIGLPVTLWFMLAIFLFITVIKTIIQIFSQYINLKLKYRVCRNIMLGAFEDFFSARWYFFSSNKLGTLLNTFSREINVIGDAFGIMARYFSVILQIALYLVLPFYLSWMVTTIIMISALVITLPFLLIGKTNYRLGQLNTATANDMVKVIHESLTSAKIILGFGNQHKSIKDLDRAYNAHAQVTVKCQTLGRAISLAYYPFGLLVLLVGLFMSRRISLPLSETIILFYSLSRVIPLIAIITEQKASLDNCFPSYEQTMNLRNYARELKQSSGNRTFAGFKQEIIVKDLSFAYPGHDKVLHNINMVIPRGRMIGIVGESGAGKSTFIDMLMYFHLPQSGHITFDGVNIEDFDINTYRRHIGYVPQDSVLFNMTIRDNLLWAKEDASEEKIKNACLQANAQEFISKLPKGYDTLVGDRGVRLSGGQIQRIALARAILRKPDLLILDEATSSLDTYSERLIQQAIENIARETTVIVIAHRLSTIVNAGYIYVFKEGRIIEEGNYLELLREDGKFKKMVELQTLEPKKSLLEGLKYERPLS